MFLLNLVEYHQPIGFQALNEAVGYPRTTTHRLVSALEIHGFLSRNEKGLLITRSRFATASLSHIAAPILKQLSADTGEITQLFVRRGLQRLVILSVESTAELRTMVPVGAALTAREGGSPAGGGGGAGGGAAGRGGGPAGRLGAERRGARCRYRLGQRPGVRR